VLEGVTYPSTLDASRLKIVFRSVDSDSESTSEAKKTKLHFLRKCNHFLRKSFSKKMILSKKMAFSKKYFRKKVQFPRHSVSLTAAETTGPAEDDLCPAQLRYTPLQPLYPQRQTTQHGPAQQHSLQWRRPAHQTIDTANHLPAQQRPCGRDNRPCKLHLSKSTLPLCSPLCRHGPKNSAVDTGQYSNTQVKRWGALVIHHFRL
jgi:hypothetical protein